MTLSHIVAASQNHVIGKDNTLPWHIPEDLKFFKEKTKGHCVIMGRKTYESVGRPLPNRLNVVITRQKDYQPEGVTVVGSLEEAVEHCKEQSDKYGDEIFIIGGGEIFRKSMDIVDLIYLTLIHQDIEGDVTYPAIDFKSFEEIERRDRTDPVPFSFLTYQRKRP